MFFVAFYGVLALVAFLNLTLMRRPGKGDGHATVCVLIPARDEAENLARLIPALKASDPNVSVYVFDDESSDGTAEVALNAGATVIRPQETLPKGWTGKNRACHELAKAVSEDSDAEWMVYLDADTYPSPDFFPRLRELLATADRRVGMVTGFPTVHPGRGIEPLFLLWVGWILLATNPYGLVARSGKGHNRFKNGQFHAWRRDVYTDVWPNEQVKGRIMEDVAIGRLLANQGIRVEVANVSEILGVKMYETWRETLDGMSKNSFEITGTTWGTIAIAALMCLFGWGWLLAGKYLLLSFGLLLLSGVCVGLTARTPKWPLLLLPVGLSIGGITMIRSLVWHRTGQVRWKGRVY